MANAMHATGTSAGLLHILVKKALQIVSKDRGNVPAVLQLVQLPVWSLSL